MKTQKFDFSKNFRAKADIADLEKLGWDFQDLYDEVFEAHQSQYKEEHGQIDPTFDMNSAAEWEQEHYHVEITINEDGGATYSMCQNAEYGNESIGQDETGDSKATIEDLKKLHAEGLLWDEENFE